MPPDNKALFEARDVSPASYDPKDSNSPTKKYMGPERRRENRRSGHDRRQDVRFELNKEDRRKTQGRRRDDETPKFW
jgi:hypothetical protein